MIDNWQRRKDSMIILHHVWSKISVNAYRKRLIDLFICTFFLMKFFFFFCLNINVSNFLVSMLQHLCTNGNVMQSLKINIYK